MSQRRTWLVTGGGGDAEPHEVSLAWDPVRGLWRATVDGEELELALGDVDEGGGLVTVDGVPLAFAMAEVPDEPGAVRIVLEGDESGTPGEVLRARSLGEVLLASAPQRRPVTAPKPWVRSPITGVVLDVPVAVGDAVAAGETVVLLEAMKMEMRLAAPADGVVAALGEGIGPGAQVRVGDGLVELRYGAPQRGDGGESQT